VRPGSSGFARALAIGAAAVLTVLALDSAVNVLMAQNPFGGPRPGGSAPQVGGIVGWLLTKQSEFYREMQRAPGIPCSLFSRGTTFVQNFGRFVPRDRGGVSTISTVVPALSRDPYSAACR